MNRIDAIFAKLRADGAKALMPYLTAGDPDLSATGELLGALQRGGASICEIGIPFSDPVADGPVIQASMTHALNKGITVGKILDTVAAARDKLDLGLVAMVSYSIVHRLGLESFVRDAKAAGFDGFIFPDLSLQESSAAVDVVAKHDMILSMLISPTTDDVRAERIARASSGFVYLLARAGVTGESMQLSTDLSQRITRLRGVTDLPIAVGFGISNKQHVEQVVGDAEAAIVGSAIMRRVADLRDKPVGELTKQVEKFVCELSTGLTTPRA